MLNPFVRLLRPEFLHQPKQLIAAFRQKMKAYPDGEVLCRLPWGMPLAVKPRDFIGRQVFRYGLTALGPCEAVFRLVKPGDTVLDVGANIGAVTAAMAFCAGADGEVIAIEMVRENFEALTANIERWKNRGSIISPINCAASNKAGEVDVGIYDLSENSGMAWVVPEGPGVAPPARKVECGRLDDIVGSSRRIRLAKLDVERHEYEVLDGAKGLIAQGRIDHIVFEDSMGPRSPAKTLLRAGGYALFLLETGLMGPDLVMVTEDEAGTIGDPNKYTDFLATSCPKEVIETFRSRGYRCLSSRPFAASQLE